MYPLIISYFSSNDPTGLGLLTTMKALLVNPNNSGKKVIIERFDITSTISAGVVVELVSNPTTNLAATSKSINCNIIDKNGTLTPPVAIFSVDNASNSQTGGQSLIKYAISTTANPIPPKAMAVYPGNSLGFNIPSIATATASIAVHWREELI